MEVIRVMNEHYRKLAPQLEADQYRQFAPCFRGLSQAAGWIVDYCQRGDRYELARHSVQDVGAQLRQTAIRMAGQAGVSLVQAYVNRLQVIESRALVGPTGPDQVRRTQVDQLTDQATWRQLQAAQTAHDQQFNPYIYRLDRPDQLQLYARHIARLPQSLAEAISNNGMATFCNGRLGDVVIFGLRLPIFLGSVLPDQPVDQPRWLIRQPSPPTT